MTEFDDEREVSLRYRRLPAEEPPARVDEAIRAEARNLAGTVPAPLVPPTGRRRWYFPLAAAAVIVLAVAVTWHVEREQPDVYVAEAPRPAAVPAPAPQPQPEATVPAPRQDVPRRGKLEAKKPSEPARDEIAPLAKEQGARDEATVLAQKPAAPAAAPQPELGAAARSDAQPRAMMERRALAETPEQWLERIAKLRAEGRHEEADRELAEFRKRNPAFRIPPEILEKVERR